MRRLLAGSVALLFCFGIGAVAAHDDAATGPVLARGRAPAAEAPAPVAPNGVAVEPAAPAQAVSVPEAPALEAATDPGLEAPALPLPGCPPPPRGPRPPGPPGPGPWKPPVLVPESELPEPLPAPAPVASLRPIEGKGMWLWKYLQSEAGDPDAIVRRATEAGLNQIWVRVGDSRDGFYAAELLNGLVPRAHDAGIAVIGWGFPYLHDPAADGAWSADALAWRSPDGTGLDGFSPDIETAAEGVVVTERRARVYLGLVRQAAGDRLVVATVFRPTDRMWDGPYPYRAIAGYVDAFAAMVYWGCSEPGATVAQAVERLSTLRPVHVIGQGWDMADEGGRAGPPTSYETQRFLDVARRHGSVGGSFWVWQFLGPEQWDAVTAFPWAAPPRPNHQRPLWP